MEKLSNNASSLAYNQLGTYVTTMPIQKAKNVLKNAINIVIPMLHFAPSMARPRRSYPFSSVPNKKSFDGGNGGAEMVPSSAFIKTVCPTSPSFQKVLPILARTSNTRNTPDRMAPPSLLHFFHILLHASILPESSIQIGEIKDRWARKSEAVPL